MTTFNELYNQLVGAVLKEDADKSLDKDFFEKYDTHQLDCLLNPEKHSLVWRLGDCDCSDKEKEKCLDRCLFDAIEFNKDGNIKIDDEQCVGCFECIKCCHAEKLTASKDIIPALKAVRSSKGLVYALVAPAFLGQFSSEVTLGKLRSALKLIGFDGLVEVALFADILTLKEALEFDANIQDESDYQLTSCCCPMWIAMIRKVYNQLMPHVPGSVSPMIACGRAIKVLHPDAVTVFIGPCLAKKAEAREKDLVGAIDYVLTFEEVQDILLALEIDPMEMEESERDHSSRTGRIYARTGGVSESVKATVERLNPHREINVNTQQADGVVACKTMINDLIQGKTDANFFEGMGCKGGCVGGPKAIINTEEGCKNVEEYGKIASYPTPLENPYVIELLHRLGFDTVESLIKHSDIFTREF
jgi:iron only hydrogenase large subunit-like protein